MTCLSLRLISRASTLTSTFSPASYLTLISLLSFSVLPFSGFAARNISSRVVTVALCFVSRTGARHEGHVYGSPVSGSGEGEARCEESWKANHSLRQEPQKVCRQSRRVRGW
jgi:hypothetical protein